MILPPLAAFSIYWHLPIMVIVISLVYSATRHDQWGAIFHEAWRWGLRMLVFLVGIGVVMYVVAAFI
ncbi:MAG TPA: hypothetical protein VGY77_01945 [Gemmataceae bacterium]|nr:hypothetical protein [Gemmataceae bacterium]